MKKAVSAFLAAAALLTLTACSEVKEAWNESKSEMQDTFSETQAGFQEARNEVSEEFTDAYEEFTETAVEAAPAALTEQYLCGTWTVSTVVLNGVSLTADEFEKLFGADDLSDIMLVFASDGSCYADEYTELSWELTEDSISLDEEALLTYQDGKLILEIPDEEDCRLLLEKRSDVQIYPAEENREAEQEAETADTASSGLRPEFKAAMDSYEAFYDEYVELVQTYQKNPANLALLSEYMDMLEELEEVDAAFEAWDDDDLTDEELEYYIDVSLRVQKKLLTAAID